MALVIGRTKSWVRWLGGLLCALVFGRAEAGELREAVKVVRVRPGRMRAAVTAEQKKQAEAFIAAYLEPVKAVEPTAEDAKKIAALIKDFGSGDFKKRSAASRAVVKHGPAALGQLREAAKSSDAEVAQRARMSAYAIEHAGRKPALDGLRKMGSAGCSVVMQNLSAARRVAAEASKALAAARKAGDAGAIAKTEAAHKDATGKMQLLNRLYYALVPQPKAAAYGIRVLGN